MGKKYLRYELDTSYWQAVPLSEAVNAELFVKDYFGHMRHHIKQIADLSGTGVEFGKTLFR